MDINKMSWSKFIKGNSFSQILLNKEKKMLIENFRCQKKKKNSDVCSNVCIKASWLIGI